MIDFPLRFVADSGYPGVSIATLIVVTILLCLIGAILRYWSKSMKEQQLGSSDFFVPDNKIRTAKEATGSAFAEILASRDRSISHLFIPINYRCETSESYNERCYLRSVGPKRATIVCEDPRLVRGSSLDLKLSDINKSLDKSRDLCLKGKVTQRRKLDGDAKSWLVDVKIIESNASETLHS